MIIIFTTPKLLANDLFSFIKALNKHLEPVGMKILDYRPAIDDIKGYELTLTVSNPTMATSQEPIQKIFINRSFDTALLIYKEEEIHKNLREDSKLELTSMFAKLFHKDQEKYYKDLPLFKKEKTIPFNSDISLFNNTNRSFIINKNKSFIASASVLFFNGTEITNYSEDKRKVDLYELREIVKSVYEKHPQITFLPKEMDNLIVVFFSTNLKYTVDIFENTQQYNNQKLGLLFLPYYDLQKDRVTAKDYQLFCQQDFGLIVEYAILESKESKKEFDCPNETKHKLEQTTQNLIDIYKARFDILSKFHIDYKKPYYYFYQQELFIDYDLSKELY